MLKERLQRRLGYACSDIEFGEYQHRVERLAKHKEMHGALNVHRLLQYNALDTDQRYNWSTRRAPNDFNNNMCRFCQLQESDNIEHLFSTCPITTRALWHAHHISLPLEAPNLHIDEIGISWASIVLLNHPTYISPVILKWMVAVLQSRQQIQRQDMVLESNEKILLVHREYQLNAPSDKVLKTFQH